ncbi:MAG: tyrosine-type recombinase/integrase [Polyangia bacterium]
MWSGNRAAPPHRNTSSVRFHKADRRAAQQRFATNHPPSPIPYYKAANVAVPAAPWHCLRHTYATTFIQNGGSVVTLQKLLGHGDIKTTMVYAHLDDEFIASEVKKRLLF